jgi:hypothetical protein
MMGISEQGVSEQHDIELGIEGYRFSDLFDAVKLKELADRFYADVEKDDPVLHSALTKYIAARGGGYERKVESKILTDAAPYLSDFIGRLFKISGERSDLAKGYSRPEPDLEIQIFCPAACDQKI